nr:hypothetical protein [Bacteroidota bacterium]
MNRQLKIKRIQQLGRTELVENPDGGIYERQGLHLEEQLSLRQQIVLQDLKIIQYFWRKRQ